MAGRNWEQQTLTLERQLIDRVEREGPITFRDFMQAALYDSEHGYYNTARVKIGPRGDYYTSGNVHAVFGAILARAFVDLLASLDQSSGASEDGPGARAPFVLVEMGAGTGQLACDVITALRDEHPAAFERLSYVIVERSPAMRALQRRRLSAFGGRVRWSALAEMEPIRNPAIFFSNEIVDAMPVHRVRFTGGGIREAWVTLNREGKLALTYGEPSSPRLAEYLKRTGGELLEGQQVEVGLDAADWLGQVARVLTRGYLVTIDYGDQSAHLWGADRRAGTLRSFFRHRITESVLAMPGHQDITASVNFTALIQYGADVGFELVSYERQAAFLMRMGLLERIARLERAGGGAIDDMKDRLAMKNFFVPGGVSDNFRVLIQRRGNY